MFDKISKLRERIETLERQNQALTRELTYARYAVTLRELTRWMLKSTPLDEIIERDKKEGGILERKEFFIKDE